MTTGSVHDGDREAARWRRQWDLAPGVIYLNHGSVGLSPRPVLDAWTEWIRRIDRQRLGFYRREAAPALREARERLAAFLDTTEENLVFMTNTTLAMLAVANSFPLERGDEVLTTDHEYWSVLQMWERACKRAGAKLVVKAIPVPVASREGIVEELFSAVTPRTRLLLFSHITFRTSITMPAEELCRRVRGLGIAVCIDGAHALVQLPLDLDGLDCDYYVASCHKWLSAPAGTGFLYVHPRRRSEVRPLCARRDGDWREVGFIGTEDYSRYLAVPAAIDFVESAGLEDFRSRTHALAQYARERIGELTGLEAWFPDAPEWYGSMVALPMPHLDPNEVREALWRDHKIESYLHAWNDVPVIRISCHLYTQAAEIDTLVEALRELAIG